MNFVGKYSNHLDSKFGMLLFNNLGCESVLVDVLVFIIKSQTASSTLDCLAKVIKHSPLFTVILH